MDECVYARACACVNVRARVHACVSVEDHTCALVSRFQPTDTLWQNGLFGCFSDVSLCCMAMLCPCIVGGKNAEGVKESCCLYGSLTCIPGFSVIGNMIIRGKIREKFLIDGGFAEDLMVSCCCGCCAAVQEGQELKLRDPYTGAIKRV